MSKTWRPVIVVVAAAFVCGVVVVAFRWMDWRGSDMLVREVRCVAAESDLDRASPQSSVQAAMSKGGDAEALDLNHCVNAIEAGIRSIDSYDVYVEVERSFLVKTIRDGSRKRFVDLDPGQAPETRTEYSRQISDAQGRHRYDRLSSPAGNSHAIELFDGENVLAWSSRSSTVRSAGDQPDQSPFESHAVNYAATFRQLPYGGSFLELFKQRSCRAFRSEDQVIVECLPDPESSYYPSFGWRFFFDPKHSMMLRRLEVYRKQMKLLRSTTEVLEFHQIDRNAWAPVSALHTFYLKGDGRPIQRAALKIDVTRSTWNRKVPDEVFRIDIPEGTRVLDAAGGHSFIAAAARTSEHSTEAELAQRYRTMLRDCGLSGFHLMVIVSSDTEGVAKFVDRNFLDHRINEDVSAFVQLVISAGRDQQKSPDAIFLKKRNWQIPSDGSVVALAFDANENELGRLEVSIAGERAEEEVAEFLHRFAPQRADAEKTWQEAFSEANRSSRRVWARTSSRYCAPCFQMARWLDDHRELLEKDYVMLKVDQRRDRNGDRVAKRLTGGMNHGVPFHAIFDQEEKMLVDSEGPFGNIGYPSGPDGKKHLRAMLLRTRQTLNDAEIDQLLESLGD